MPGVASGIIVLWPGTNASIPTDWTRVTDMDTRFSKGTATPNPDVTGGAATHGHTSPGHTHTIGSHTHSGTTGGPTLTIAGFVSGSGSGESTSTHTHSYSSGSQTATAESTGATWQTAGNEPTFYEMIYIQSNGVPIGVPEASCVWFNGGTAPRGFTQHSGSEGRFIQGPSGGRNGGDTGGGSTHSHTANSHSHTIANHAHGSRTSSSPSSFHKDITGSNTDRNRTTHTHTISFSSTPSAGTGGRTSARTSSDKYEPEFHTLLCIENTSGRKILIPDLICMYLGTKASIPLGWVECDGSNGTPNLQNKFIKAAASGGGNVGTTGGDVGHDHTDPTSHDHTTRHHHTISSGTGARKTRGGGFGTERPIVTQQFSQWNHRHRGSSGMHGT